MKVALFSVWALVFSLSAAMAGQRGYDGLAGNLPDCLDHDGSLPVNNEEVLNWKDTTRNTYLARGHVHGVVTQVYPDRNGHHHFQLRIGKGKDDTIEIIYNEAFGSTPGIEEGTDVEACGDYITSNAQNGPYPASPDGAILHWVHMSPRPERHLSGYIAVNGEAYGLENPNDNGQRRRH